MNDPQNQARCRPDNLLLLIISREACVGFFRANETYGSSICGLIRLAYPQPVAIFGPKPVTFIDKICFSHRPYVLNGFSAPSAQVTNCSDSAFIVSSCMWICCLLMQKPMLSVTVSLAIQLHLWHHCATTCKLICTATVVFMQEMLLEHEQTDKYMRQ